MLKKFLAIFIISIAAFTTNGIYGSVPSASAEQVYASSTAEADWYVESNEISGTRSGLTYAGVYTSEGEHFTFCFDGYKGWKFQYWRGGIGSQSHRSSWIPVSKNQLANDILYVALNLKENM